MKSSYEQLMKACLIVDDTDHVETQITEQSQLFAQQSSQQYTTSSQQSAQLSIDSKPFSPITNDIYDEMDRGATKRKINDDMLSMINGNNVEYCCCYNVVILHFIWFFVVMKILNVGVGGKGF